MRDRVPGDGEREMPMFDDYLQRWHLVVDGVPIVTSTSQLLPVRAGDAPAMLKTTSAGDEKRGGTLLDWWDGDGAARVLAQGDGALLVERAVGNRSLAQMARGGQDDEVCRIICSVVARLHAPRVRPPPPDLIPLSRWFGPLETMAGLHGGILRVAAETAAGLLATPQEPAALHGDVHHANILDFEARGWLAIDPKGLVGERGFDYANLFCNPDFGTAPLPDQFRRRIEVVTEAARLERKRLLAWVLAWAGLSAAFALEDGLAPRGIAALAEMAAGELGG